MIWQPIDDVVEFNCWLCFRQLLAPLYQNKTKQASILVRCPDCGRNNLYYPNSKKVQGDT